MDTALGKGLRVLEKLCRVDGPVRLSHLAAQLDLQKSSVHRVLRMLMAEGYVAQDPDTELYRPTLKVWELGSAVVGGLPSALLQREQLVAEIDERRSFALAAKSEVEQASVERQSLFDVTSRAT